MFNDEKWVKALRKIHPNRGVCFVHTFSRFSCVDCEADVMVQSMLYGNLSFLKTTWGLILLKDNFPEPEPIGLLNTPHRRKSGR